MTHTDALPFDGDEEWENNLPPDRATLDEPMYGDDQDHCPKCGMVWAWDGDTEASRVCPPCLTGE